MYKYRFTLSKQATGDDFRPVIWPIEHPYWCSGENDTHYTLVAFQDSRADILRLWPEAEQIEELGRYEAPVFSSRFPCPSWYLNPRMAILKERYTIFEAEWSWGTAHVLFRKDGTGFCHLNIYKDEDIPSISSIFVQPDARKKGIGTQLLKDAEELARLHNFYGVFLWATPDGWCKDWYHRHGYRHIDNHDPVLADGEVFMEKVFTIYNPTKK